MFAVSPPSYKDFQPLAPLCSPGDGWRRFNPPPPPTVQPAFHFLSSLLEQPAIAPLPSIPKLRPPMDPSLNGSLEKMMNLPLEVLDLISSYVVVLDNGPNLSLASHLFHTLTTRHLYRSVDLPSHNALALFSRTIQDQTDLTIHVKRLGLLCHRPQWAHMHKLAEAMDHQGQGARLVELRVRFQSSDLQEAVPFLSHFLPISFEWITSPCWLMRPAHLFKQFLSSWTTIESLTLGNFRFDHVLVDCVAVVPSLRNLVLKGSGTSHLDADTLGGILSLDARRKQTSPLESVGAICQVRIEDCPLLVQIAVLEHLRTDPSHHLMPLSCLSWD